MWNKHNNTISSTQNTAGKNMNFFLSIARLYKAITFDKARKPIAIASYLIKLAIARYFEPNIKPTINLGNNAKRMTHNAEGSKIKRRDL